jgi:hypothetical protein
VSVLVPAVLSLFGVGLGTVGTLVGQHLSSRVITRQQDTRRWAAHRAELKASVLRFLGAVRHVQQGGAGAVTARELRRVQIEFMDAARRDLWAEQPDRLQPR